MDPSLKESMFWGLLAGGLVFYLFARGGGSLPDVPWVLVAIVGGIVAVLAAAWIGRS